MNDPYKISFIEGDLKVVTITVPDELTMTDKKAKVQIRHEPGAPVKMEFSTVDTPLLFTLVGQQILWTIPGFMSVGKAGAYQWEIGIYSNETDPKRVARGLFEIIPSITQI